MEKNLKHTPLPWSKDFGGSVGHIKSIAAATPKGNTPTICRYDRDFQINRACSISEEEANANAEFIVNCCNSHYDLLEALKEISALCEKGLNWYANGEADKNLFKSLTGLVTEKSKAAIEKARHE